MKEVITQRHINFEYKGKTYCVIPSQNRVLQISNSNRACSGWAKRELQSYCKFNGTENVPTKEATLKAEILKSFSKSKRAA